MTEADCRESLNAFEGLFNEIEDYLFIVGEKGEIIEANRSAVQRLGYSLNELQVMKILDLYPPERRDEAFAHVKKMLEGKNNKCLIPLYTKDGEYIPVETRVFSGVLDGKNVGFGICKDVTEASNANERFIKSFQDNPAPMAISRIDNGEFIDVNQSFLDGLGFERNEVVGQKIMDLGIYLDNEERNIIGNEIKKRGKIRDREVLVQDKNGEILIGLLSANIIGSGKDRYILSAINDITEKRKKEKEVVESKAQLKAQREYAEMLLDTVPSAVFSIDKNQKITSWNKWAQLITGYTAEEIIGKECSLFSNECCKECELYSKNFVKTALRQVCTIRNKNGEKRYIIKNMDVLRNEMGEIIGGIECFDDITDRIHMEKRLRESEERYSAIVNSAPEIVIIHKKGKIIFINDAGLRSSGYERNEIIGHSVLEFISESSKELVLSAMERRVNEKSIGDYEVEFFKKTGEVVDLIVKTSKITYENEAASLSVLIDISERKRTEEELNNKEKLLSAVAMSIKELLHNPNYYDAAIRGFEILGKAAGIDRVYLFENQYNDSGQGTSSQKIEWNSGVSWPQLDNPELQNIPFEKIDSIIKPLINGEPFLGIVRELNARTREHLEAQDILALVVLPIFVRGEFWGFIGFDECKYERKWSPAEFSTLTAFANALEKAIERSMTEKELEISRQNAETASVLKGQFLANMSHEIRTPMNGITGFVELLLRTEINKEQSEFLNEIKKASDALLHLLKDILDYSKIEADKLELEHISFDISSLVEDSVALFAPRVYEKGLEISSYIFPDVPECLLGDPGRLRQVVHNLIANALKFTESGEISVEVSVIENRENSIRIQFKIMDTGIGMNEEVISKLFTVFSQADASTTRKYGGTGLGLAISQRLIGLMGGKIRAESIPSEGTSFYIEAEFEKSVVYRKDRISGSANLAGKEILIADSNKSNRIICRRYLEDVGCQVTEADSIKQVLEIYKKSQENKKQVIIIMDYKMIYGDNEKSCELFSAEKTSEILKIFLLSYDNQKINQRIFQPELLHGYIRKPIKKKELINAISTGLEVELITEKEAAGPHLHQTNDLFSDLTGKLHYRLLLVEDILANQKLAAAMLKQLGYSVEVAGHGVEALSMCNTNKYDIILMDCQMPLMDGYEASAIIRHDKGKNKDTVIIGLTAGAMEGDRERCLTAGMDDYLSKPIIMSKLDRIIKKWLAKSSGRY